MLRVYGNNLYCDPPQPDLILGVNMNQDQAYEDEWNQSTYLLCPLVVNSTTANYCDFQCECDASNDMCDVHLLTFGAAITICDIQVKSAFNI